MTRDWFKKIRSILSLGGFGAAFAGGVAGIWSLFSGITSGYLVGELVLTNVVLWAFFGGFSSAGFAVALLALRSRRQLQDIGLYWTALVGGTMGALALVVVSAFLGGSWIPVIGDLPILGVFAALGAGLTTGIVAIAQGLPRARLDEASPNSTLLEEPTDSPIR